MQQTNTDRFLSVSTIYPDKSSSCEHDLSIHIYIYIYICICFRPKQISDRNDFIWSPGWKERGEQLFFSIFVFNFRSPPVVINDTSLRNLISKLAPSWLINAEVIDSACFGTCPFSKWLPSLSSWSTDFKMGVNDRIISEKQRPLVLRD